MEELRSAPLGDATAAIAAADARWAGEEALV
jgi:hypothetical protein